jgi:hypothetical protein
MVSTMRSLSLAGRLVVACLLCGSAARAQESTANSAPHGFDRRSHRSLDDESPGFRATEEYLASRLNRARDLQRIQDLTKRLLDDPDFLDKLRSDLKSDDLARLQQKAQSDPAGLLNDPALRSFVEHLQQRGTLNPEDSELLNRFVPPTPRPNLPTPPMPVPSPPMPPMLPNQPPMPSVTAPSPPRVAANPETGEGPPRTWLSRQLQSLTERLNELDAEDRAALTELFRQFRNGTPIQLDSSESARWPALAGWLGRAGEWLPMDRIRPRDLVNSFRGWSLPRLPSFSGRPGMPTVAPGAPIAGEQIASTVISLLIGLGLALVVWKGIEHYQSARRDGATLAAIGPWPVEPSAIQSREEVVQAFEFLAVCELGPPARPCHHRLLVDRLAALEETSERRAAAVRLGAAYELARYAPPNTELTEGQLAIVRRDLVTLARVVKNQEPVE